MENQKKNQSKKPQAKRPLSDRNRREMVPNLPETHKLLTAVQFGDRAAFLVRKRMSLDDTGPLPASKALGLLDQYSTAVRNYIEAVDALCLAAALDLPKSVKKRKDLGK